MIRAQKKAEQQQQKADGMKGKNGEAQEESAWRRNFAQKMALIIGYHWNGKPSVSVSNPTMPYWIVFEIFFILKSFSKSIA